MSTQKQRNAYENVCSPHRHCDEDSESVQLFLGSLVFGRSNKDVDLESFWELFCTVQKSLHGSGRVGVVICLHKGDADG